MYKAVYDHASATSNALSFVADDYFILMDSRNADWWLMLDATGVVGYVPASYITQQQETDSEVLRSIDRAMDVVLAQATPGQYTSDQTKQLQKLLQHRRCVAEQEHAERQASIRLAQQPITGTHTSQPGNREYKEPGFKPIQSAPVTPNTHTSPHAERDVTDGLSRQSSQDTSQNNHIPVNDHVIGSAQSKGEKQRKGSKKNSKKKAAPLNPDLNMNQSQPTKEELSPVNQNHSNEIHPAQENNVMSSHKTSSMTAHQSDSAIKYQSQSSSAMGTSASDEGHQSSPGLNSPSRKEHRKKKSKAPSRPESQSTIEGHERVPAETGHALIELVRRKTDLSYDMSQVTVRTVVEYLRDILPGAHSLLQAVLCTLPTQKESDSGLSPVESQDAQQLRVILGELTACKDDSQQRSWALHEDEGFILNNLNKLLSILNNANPAICKHVLKTQQYKAIHDLVLYYQMESRVSLRLQLLQVFGALCSLDANIISELLNSVLPLEIARDMQADTQDIQKLGFSALVLTMMLSMGEPLPFTHYDHLNVSFVDFLLTNIDCCPSLDLEERVPDLFVNLILALNLHYELPGDSHVMKTLASTGTAKTFSEKIMLLVNREDDPVRMFEHEPVPPHSVLKLMTDLYSDPATSSLLYTNDAMVLIDIVLRQLQDRSPGDTMRTEYLSLVQLILANSSYSDHCHRRADLEACFQRIGSEEEADTDMDKRIVSAIWRQFPDHFHQPGACRGYTDL